MIYKKSLCVVFLFGFGIAQCGKPWQVTYNKETNEYVGTKEKWPHAYGAFKNYIIQVSEESGSYSGVDINDYGDGNVRPLSDDYAKLCFAKFKEIYDKNKTNKN